MAPEPEDEMKDEKNPPPLDEDDIALLKTYVSIYLLSFSSSPICNPSFSTLTDLPVIFIYIYICSFFFFLYMHVDLINNQSTNYSSYPYLFSIRSKLHPPQTDSTRAQYSFPTPQDLGLENIKLLED